jgi:hypothetical protein
MDKPCPTCPFLAVNKDKPNPTGFKCEAENETQWYSQENIDGVWEKTRLGPIMFLSCHTTDPDYFGREDGKIYACMGGTLSILMHLRIFEKYAGNYDNYVKTVGEDVAMSRAAIKEKLLALSIGRTSPLWGSMYLPENLHVHLDAFRWPTGFKRTVKEFKKIISK